MDIDINIIKNNATILYYSVGIITALVALFRWVRSKFNELHLVNLWKLMIDVPEKIDAMSKKTDTISIKLEIQNKIINTILEKLDVCQILCDAEGKCIKVNNKWSYITGISAENAEGNQWLLAVHADDRDRVSQRWASMVSGHSVFKETFRYQHAESGVITKVTCTATDVLDDNNKRQFIIGLSTVVS